MALAHATNISHLTQTTQPIIVHLPNGKCMHSTHTALLDIPDLPTAARIVHLFPDMTTGPLLSIAQLCDAGCTATYRNDQVTIHNATNTLIMSGPRCPDTGLWSINLHSPTHQMVDTSLPTQIKASPASHATAAAIVNPTSIKDRVAYYHACLGFPAISTMIAACDQGFIDFPGLTSTMIRKYPPNHPVTSLGHLDQTRQGIQSTKLTMDVSTEEPTHSGNPNTSSKCVITKIIPWQQLSHRTYSDKPGRFPVKSKRGHEYILIMYSEDGNYIHAVPMRTRGASDHINAYKSGVEFFSRHGCKPHLEYIDNECSKSLMEYCATENIHIQLLPPNNHRASKAERAIRTFKNHYISILCGLDPSFPLTAWDELLAQAELTLNLLRSSHANPHISAWQQVHGRPYRYLSTPIAPLGTSVVIFEPPSTRASWAPHGKVGWYVGPAMSHYRCFSILVKDTNAVRVTDTLAWHPREIPFPMYHPHEAVAEAIDALALAITNLSSPSTMPSAAHDTPQPLIPDHRSTQLLKDLHELQQIFQIRAPVSTMSLPAERTDANVQRVVDSLHPSTVAADQRVAVVAPGQPQDTSNDNNRPQRQSAPVNRLTYGPRHVQIAAAAMELYNDIEPVSYREAIKGPHRDRWIQAHEEEFERLINTWQCMKFITASNKPIHQKATYYNPQIKIKVKDNELVFRVRGTVGGDVITYNGNKSAQTSSLTTVKLLLNAAVSEDAELCTGDISDFYLTKGNNLEKPEYMWINMNDIPTNVQQKYNLHALAQNGKVLVEITGAMYGLPQAGRISQDQLVKHLAMYGYGQCQNTPCLFKHETNSVMFTLVVDDFCIKYKDKQDLQHFLDAIQTRYKFVLDMNAKRFIGITFTRDRAQRTLTLSMPHYVELAIKRFTDGKPLPTSHSPMLYVPPKYGSAAQQLVSLDQTLPLTKERQRRIQQIVGTFLYYARAVDPTMLTAINKLASQQATATEATELAAQRLLAYANTYPNASIVIKASNMQLICHSDASYLSETKSRSRAGAIFFLTNHDHTMINGSINCISSIIDVTVASAAEAEYAALYLAGQEIESLRPTLADLGYPQHQIPVISDNKCAVGLANGEMKAKRSKAFDMRWHWLQDRVSQHHFNITWQPGSTNLADAFTKATSVKTHQTFRPCYVHDAIT